MLINGLKLMYYNNTQALGGASKLTGLEGSADKTKYMPTSPDQNAGRSYNIYHVD